MFKIDTETKVDVTRANVFTAKRRSVVDLQSKIESRVEFHQIGKSKNPRAMAFVLENSNIKKLNNGRSQINLKLYHRVLKASYKNAVFKSQPFTEARVVKSKRRNVNDFNQHSVLCAQTGEATVYKTADDKVFKDLANRFNTLTISTEVSSGETKVDNLFTTTDIVAETLNVPVSDALESNTSKGLKRKSSPNADVQVIKRQRV